MNAVEQHVAASGPKQPQDAARHRRLTAATFADKPKCLAPLELERVRVDGAFTIDDFNEEFDTELGQNGFHTMAGLVFHALGRAPEVGDNVQIDGLRLTVVEVEGPRIVRLEVEFGTGEEPPSDEHETA